MSRHSSVPLCRCRSPLLLIPACRSVDSVHRRRLLGMRARVWTLGTKNAGERLDVQYSGIQDACAMHCLWVQRAGAWYFLTDLHSRIIIVFVPLLRLHLRLPPRHKKKTRYIHMLYLAERDTLSSRPAKVQWKCVLPISLSSFNKHRYIIAVSTAFAYSLFIISTLHVYALPSLLRTVSPPPGILMD